MPEDTINKTQSFASRNDETVDENGQFSKPGDLVVESGEYKCEKCEYEEDFTAGEEFTECECLESRGWELVQSDADSE
ncbi:hypothetical protein ACFL2D_00295 [Patescibacteria group bacterium]